VIPTIQIDADSRNIEEITVTQDETRYRPRKTEEELKALEAEGMEFNEYHGIMKQMEKGTLVIDDLSHHEMDTLIAKYKPDVFCAGIKEKFVVQKMGIPLKQLHNYDAGGPYAGFQGAVNFYKDIEMMVGAAIWKEIKAPWESEDYVEATFAY
jgi:nitrogenase molybdenum-iron protein alpha chain